MRAATWSTIPIDWRGELREVESKAGGIAWLAVRYARSGDLVDAYPAGTHDREVVVEGEPTQQALQGFVADILQNDPLCRRVVMAVPEGDLVAIRWAEDAGFRFVVNVETRVAAYSLLVVEPDWVLAQPHSLEDIPIKE